ncbi:MAG: hypothetical protein D6722_01885 [Bacteroidetes bacterium]|nr:MAG: hypothetical protein D6722_01885 [Bacteroidota bacterium]
MRYWLLLLSLGPLWLFGQIPPPPPAYQPVSDYAGLFSPAEVRELAAPLRRLERRRGIQIAIVTRDSLDGLPLEPYALELARRWGIGQRGADNGLLILVAVRERGLRIETGRGLVESLPPAWTQALVDSLLVPAFAQGQYAEGLAQAIAQIEARLSPPPRPWWTRAYALGLFLVELVVGWRLIYLPRHRRDFLAGYYRRVEGLRRRWLLAHLGAFGVAVMLSTWLAWPVWTWVIGWQLVAAGFIYLLWRRGQYWEARRQWMRQRWQRLEPQGLPYEIRTHFTADSLETWSKTQQQWLLKQPIWDPRACPPACLDRLGAEIETRREQLLAAPQDQLVPDRVVLLRLRPEDEKAWERLAHWYEAGDIARFRQEQAQRLPEVPPYPSLPSLHRLRQAIDRALSHPHRYFALDLKTTIASLRKILDPRASCWQSEAHDPRALAARRQQLQERLDQLQADPAAKPAVWHRLIMEAREPLRGVAYRPGHQPTPLPNPFRRTQPPPQRQKSPRSDDHSWDSYGDSDDSSWGGGDFGGDGASGHW